MPSNSVLLRIGSTLAILAFAFAAAPSALATKKEVVGPVAFEVPDSFAAISGKPPGLHEEKSGITIEVTELPPEALKEFKGAAFLDFLASLGYTNAAYGEHALKRTDAHTFVTADAKGKQGPESRFLLVLGGAGRAAIVTAYAPKSQIASGAASTAGIEEILSSAIVVAPDGSAR